MKQRERSLVGLRVLLLTLTALLLCARSSDAQVSTRYVYDPLGRLVQVIEADGTTVTYDYDAVGNLLRRLVSRPTDSAGAITGIYPTAVEPATEAEVTIFGVGLTTAVGVTFDVPGITASLEGAPEDTALSLLVRVAATVGPGPHIFTVNRASLPPIASGTVALNVTARPVLIDLAPAQVLTGATVDQFTLSGARLDRSPTVVFDRSGLALTNVIASADGTSLTGRLQVALNMVPGPVGVSVRTSEGTTRKVTLTVAGSVPGLTGSYFANVFSLDGAGLPVVPVTSPSFIRSDAALQFGTFTGFKFRPCFIATSGCLNKAYTVRWQGNIFLESAGTYTFALNSSDASQLLIGGGAVVSNPGTHTASTEQGMFVAPASGSYPLVVLFNTSGATPGIDLLYQPPGAATLSLVPGTVLWGDGSAYDPVLMSAAAAVSVANPATPASPGGTNPIAGATATVSFMNPAPIPQPGGVAPTSATTSAVSFFSPGAVPEPGGTSPITAVGVAVSFANPSPVAEPGGSAPVESTNATVSFFSPAAVPEPGGTSPIAAAGVAVSFANPSPVDQPGGSAPVESTNATVSFSNPASVVSPGGSAPVSAALAAVAFAAGPVVYQVTPTQLSRSAGGGVLTIRGENLQDATAVLFENGSGISAGPPAASVDGHTVTTMVTLTPTTPTGFVAVKVSTPTGVSAASATTVLEIVP